jgi:putative transposon-encoded protein
VEFVRSTKIILDGVAGFMKRTVTRFGTGAKVDCPKEYLGKEVYLVVIDDESSGSTGEAGKIRAGKQRSQKEV